MHSLAHEREKENEREERERARGANREKKLDVEIQNETIDERRTEKTQPLLLFLFLLSLSPPNHHHRQASRLKKRMQFLLKQADIFQHFMPSGSSAAAADDDAKNKKKKKSRHASGRASEDAEDAALLADEAAEDADASGHRLTVQPGVVKGTMRKYQLEGLNWLIHLYDNSMNGILADEMGLGKTLQTISLLGYLHEYRGITGPHLVIVPKSTLHNWINEFRKWCPAIRAVKFHGNKEQRAEQKANIMVKGAFDACVTSFEMVIKEKSTFLGFKWKYVIIDEAHRIKREVGFISSCQKARHELPAADHGDAAAEQPPRAVGPFALLAARDVLLLRRIRRMVLCREHDGPRWWRGRRGRRGSRDRSGLAAAQGFAPFLTPPPEIRRRERFTS